jgi:hypothetical protein
MSDFLLNKCNHFPHFLWSVGGGKRVMLLDVADASEESSSLVKGYFLGNLHFLENG